MWKKFVHAVPKKHPMILPECATRSIVAKLKVDLQNQHKNDTVSHTTMNFEVKRNHHFQTHHSVRDSMAKYALILSHSSHVSVYKRVSQCGLYVGRYVACCMPKLVVQGRIVMWLVPAIRLDWITILSFPQRKWFSHPIFLIIAHSFSCLVVHFYN